MPELPVDPALLEAYVCEILRAKWASVPDAGNVYAEEIYADDSNDFVRQCTVERAYGEGETQKRVNYALVRFVGFEESEAGCAPSTNLTLNYLIELFYEFERKRPDGTSSTSGFKALVMRGRDAFRLDRSLGHLSDQLWHNFLQTEADADVEIVDGVESHTMTLSIGVELHT